MDQALLSLLASDAGLLQPSAPVAGPSQGGAAAAAPFTQLLQAALDGVALTGDEQQALLAQLLAFTPLTALPAPVEGINLAADGALDPDQSGNTSPGSGNSLPAVLATLLRLRGALTAPESMTPSAAPVTPSTWLAAPTPQAAAALEAPVTADTPVAAAPEAAVVLAAEPELDPMIRSVLDFKNRPLRDGVPANMATPTTPRVEPNSLTNVLSDLAKVLVPRTGDAIDESHAMTALSTALRRNVAASAGAETFSNVASSSALSAFETTAATLRPGRAEFVVPQPPADPTWADAFAERVTFAVTQQLQQAELRLNPPQLGHIELRISIAQDQASVTFSSSHVAVRDAIEAALPRLRESLAEAGLSLVNVDISDRSLAYDRRQPPFEQPASRSPGHTADFDVVPEAPRLLGLSDGRTIDCFA